MTQLKPRSLLLVHGAGSGPWVFDGWEEHFRELEVAAVDLMEGLNVEQVSMQDYASRVLAAAKRLGKPLALCGWSMGGLVALMAAGQIHCDYLVLIEASAPGEVQGFNPSIKPRAEAFDSESVYGAFPPGIPSRPESQYARDERKRGISVPAVPCPTLIISGRSHPIDRGSDLAGFYAAKLVEFPEQDHWELIATDSVKEAIREFIGLPIVAPAECA
jgi:pimeloyl-ACP methyl ester carboxylesterase